jgi:acyl-coenzyme A synthetase/AMP-(fatty) acid ligase
LSSAPEIAARWARGRGFIKAKGPTEATIGPTMYVADGQARGVAGVPIGRPIPNIQVYLLDAHHQPVPLGVAGEICIGGVGLARGYLNRPDLTAEKFVPNPFTTTDPSTPLRAGDGRLTTEDGVAASGGRWSVVGGRLYRTGDSGRYLPDGPIEFVGRVDQQVKIRGFRIELGEVEAALKRHSNVREAVVLAREDAPGDQRLVAYLVPRDLRLEIGDSAPDTLQSPISNLPRELRDFLKDQLPEYMLPTVFVTLDALPLTPNGKVDRKALAAPKGTRPELAATYVMPRNELEQTLAAIWQDVLLVDQVGIDDNFFDLGGHSLLMAKAHSQLQAALQREISIVELFRHPTIGALAEYLSKAPVVRSLQENADRAEKQRSGLQRQQQRMQAVAQRRAAGRQRR